MFQWRSLCHSESKCIQVRDHSPFKKTILCCKLHLKIKINLSFHLLEDVSVYLDGRECIVMLKRTAVYRHRVIIKEFV